MPRLPMRRRSLAVVATAVLVGVGLGACDTDDGREMREPTELQRWRQEGTTTTTTSTTTLPPTTPPVIVTAPDTAAPDSAADTSEAAADPSGSSGAPDGSEAGLVAPGSEAGAADDTEATAAAGLTAPWSDGAAIDAAFTCDGTGDAPLIEWDAPPAGTVEMALTVLDEDANGYVHWAVFGLPASAGSIGGGAALAAGTEGRNSRAGTGWTGPCPPAGTTHEYRVTLHFLGQQLEETADAAPSALVAAIEAVAFDEVSITGTYQRAG